MTASTNLTIASTDFAYASLDLMIESLAGMFLLLQSMCYSFKNISLSPKVARFVLETDHKNSKFTVQAMLFSAKCRSF
jgi:hypothetical protein